MEKTPCLHHSGSDHVQIMENAPPPCFATPNNKGGILARNPSDGLELGITAQTVEVGSKVVILEQILGKTRV